MSERQMRIRKNEFRQKCVGGRKEPSETGKHMLKIKNSEKLKTIGYRKITNYVKFLPLQFYLSS